MADAGIDDTWIVVRGGVGRSAEGILSKVFDAIEDDGRAEQCVFAGAPVVGRPDVETGLDIAHAGRIPHKQIQIGSVGALRQAGFTVELDTSDGQAHNHYAVNFREPVDVEQARAFVECFGDPIPNPRYWRGEQT